MAVMTIGTDITVETVEALCRGCYAEPVATDWGLGADCADYQFGSDQFKDEYGFRPRLIAPEAIIAWVRGESRTPWG